jgi:voltage-gated potassium channel
VKGKKPPLADTEQCILFSGGKTMKRRVFEVIEKAEDGDIPSTIFDVSIILLIVLNVIAVTASSFNSFQSAHNVLLHRFEVTSVIIFTIEYLLRVWTAAYKFPESKHPYCKYIFSAGAVIDLAAILPFYLPFVTGVDLRFLRILRLLRMFRIFKLGRYSESMAIIGRVMKKEKEKLITTVVLTIIMIFMASTVMYYVENPAQPEVFTDIIETTWWSIATFTTIWLGDIYPITIAGKICGGVISLLGIMLIALPSGIICSGFMNELEKDKKTVCPHCGKEIEN